MVPAKLGVKSANRTRERGLLRAARHDDAAEPRGLLPAAEHQVRVGRDRETRTNGATPISRGLRRHHDGTVSDLASVRSVAPDPKAHVILPETISKEPLAPVVRQNDANWRDIVSWTVHAMVAAEELKITQANVDTFLTTRIRKCSACSA